MVRGIDRVCFICNCRVSVDSLDIRVMRKNKDSRNEYAREYMRKRRQGLTKEAQGLTKGVTRDMTDLLDKLTDKDKWRPRLEKICGAFQASHHPSDIDTCFLGNYELPLVCELMEVTG